MVMQRHDRQNDVHVGAGQNYSVQEKWPIGCQLDGPPKEQRGYSEQSALESEAKLLPWLHSAKIYNNRAFSGRSEKTENSRKG